MSAIAHVTLPYWPRQPGSIIHPCSSPPFVTISKSKCNIVILFFIILSYCTLTFANGRKWSYMRLSKAHFRVGKIYSLHFQGLLNCPLTLISIHSLISALYIHYWTIDFIAHYWLKDRFRFKRSRLWGSQLTSATAIGLLRDLALVGFTLHTSL